MTVAWLYQRHSDRVFNFAYRACLDRELAIDVTRQAFAGAAQRLDELELAAIDVETYLLAATHQIALQATAARNGRALAAPLEPEPFDAYADPARAAARAGAQLMLLSAATRLPPRHRHLLAMRDGAGLSYAEMAEIVAQPLPAMARALTRARLRLHEELSAGAPPHRAVGMDCVEALPLLSLHADEAIPPRANRWLVGHLAGCETCEYNLAALVEARDAYREWLDLRPPARLGRRVIAEEASAMPRRRALAAMRFRAVRRLAAAGAVAGSLLVISMGAWLTPSDPSDTLELVGADSVAGEIANVATQHSRTSRRATARATGAASASADSTAPEAYLIPTIGGDGRPAAPGSRRTTRQTAGGGPTGGLAAGKRRRGGKGQDERRPSQAALIAVGLMPDLDAPVAVEKPEKELAPPDAGTPAAAEKPEAPEQPAAAPPEAPEPEEATQRGPQANESQASSSK